MFRRREPLGFLQKLREACWPSMGWWRTGCYFYHRILRGADSTYRITAGLSLGVAVSFIPLIGTHIIQAAFLSVLIRASWLASVVGTVWGNPWTFPFLFWMSYKTGVFVCSLFGFSDFVALPDFMTSDYFFAEPTAFMAYLFGNPLRLFLPMVLGGYICAILFWPVIYAILYYPVKKAQTLYRKERMKRIYKQAPVCREDCKK